MDYGTLNTGYVASWFSEPDERPMWALNLMRYRAIADYGDGRAPVSGWAADDAYAPLGPLSTVGARIVLVAPVIRQLAGDAVRWDRVAVVRYPRRTAMAEMEQLTDFQQLHVHKNAGMESTIVAATFPRYDVSPAAPDPDGRLLLEVVADAAAPSLGDSLGAAPVGRFDVEDVIIGDGRRWQEARWHRVPAVMCRGLVQRAAEYRPDGYAVLVEALVDTVTEELQADGSGHRS